MCAANEVAVPMGSHVANMNECGRYRCASGQHIASELTLGLYWVCIRPHERNCLYRFLSVPRRGSVGRIFFTDSSLACYRPSDLYRST